MMQAAVPATNIYFLWGTLVFIVLLVAILTYLYSGKNLRVTLGFTCIAIFTILIGAGQESFTHYLNNHFIGRYDEFGVPYRYSRLGWQLLIDAWPIWILPSILVAGVTVIVIWLFAHYLTPDKNNVTVYPQVIPQPDIVDNSGLLTRDMVTYQLELDKLKREVNQLNERLAKANEAKSAAEKKYRELMQSYNEKQQLAQHADAELAEQIQNLRMQLNAKEAEIQALKEQIANQTQQILDLQNALNQFIEKL